MNVKPIKPGEGDFAPAHSLILSNGSRLIVPSTKVEEIKEGIMSEKLLTHEDILRLEHRELLLVNAPISLSLEKLNYVKEQYPNANTGVYSSSNMKKYTFLSREYNILYVDGIEEITEQDWISLLTRTTGRAGSVVDGKFKPNMPYSQVFSICSKDRIPEWAKNRETLATYEVVQSFRQLAK